MKKISQKEAANMLYHLNAMIEAYDINILIVNQGYTNAVPTEKGLEDARQLIKDITGFYPKTTIIRNKDLKPIAKD